MIAAHDVEPDHPVQQAVKAAFEQVTAETSPGHGIDGCSAPNFACTLEGLARAMAAFAPFVPTLVGGSADLVAVRDRVRATGEELGEKLRVLVGKPGLDGHSNGAEQIAFRARDCGMDITYDGIRLTPEQIVAAARDQQAHVVGLSILSGSHLPLVRDVMERMRAAGLGNIPVIVGGIIPDEDAKRLTAMGVARVYTPKDFGLTEIMGGIVDVIRAARGLA